MPGSVVLRLAPLPVRKLLAGAPDFALRPVALSRTRGDVCGSRRPSRCPGVRASAAARCPALLCFPRWLRLVRQLQALRALGIAPEQPQRAAREGNARLFVAGAAAPCGASWRQGLAVSRSGGQPAWLLSHGTLLRILLQAYLPAGSALPMYSGKGSAVPSYSAVPMSTAAPISTAAPMMRPLSPRLNYTSLLSIPTSPVPVTMVLRCSCLYCALHAIA